MGFFTSKQMPIYAVVDAGGGAVKAAIFEMPLTRGTAHSVVLPRVLEKFVWDLPIACPPVRLVKKIRENVLGMAGKTGRMPQKIVIALGPEVGEYALQNWIAAPIGAPTSEPRIREEYERLFKQHADPRRAMIVSPIEMLVNDRVWVGDALSPARRPVAQEYADEIRFRVLALYVSLENGALFSDLKNNFSGIPVSFIPLAIAEHGAVAREMKMRDAFLIDVGATATTLVSLREGRMAHVAFVPCGIGRMAEIAAKKCACPLREARLMIRGYAEGNLIGAARDTASAAAMETAAEWKLHFVRALDTFYPAGPLSPMVLLTGGGARFSEIRAAVEASDWLGGFSYAEKPTVRVLDGTAFFGGNTLGGYMQGSEDAGLAALIAHCIDKN